MKNAEFGQGRRWAPLAGACAVAVLAVACRQTAKDEAFQIDPQADRLRRHYPQLHEGRFSVIADFESPAHAGIVHAINASGDAYARPSATAGRPATGAQALQCRLGSREDAIVFSGETSGDWTLKRDWRGFDLLMFVIHSPKATRVEIEVRGGRGEAARRYTEVLSLSAGWNTAELDVFAPGTVVPLDDVRELRLKAAADAFPLELTLDDVILTSDRQSIVSTRDAVRGTLFLERQGHRLNVGVSGRYQWTFDRGRIVAWHDLTTDPNRLRNLVSRDAPFGPCPVPRNSDHRGQPGENRFSRPPTETPGRQELIEHSPARVRIRVGTPATPSLPPGSSDSTAHETPWEAVYTFYPSAQVYVSAALKNPAVEKRVWAWGHGSASWTRTEAVDFDVAGTGAPEDRATMLLTTMRTVESPPVLILGRDASGPAQVEISESTASGETDAPANPCCFFLPSTADTQSQVFFHLAWLDKGSHDDVEARARDYLAPQRLIPLQGKVEPAGPGEPPGLPDFSRGCYRLIPDGGAVRLEIDGRRTPRHFVAFEVAARPDDTCWIYVSHRLLNPIVTRPDGTRLFQVPSIVRGLTPVEVLFTTASSP